jgi:hypothetical protein
MLYKQDIEKVKKWTLEQAEYCWELWRVEFSYDHYDPEVRTFYVREHQANTNKAVEFEHLKELQGFIQSEFGDRYKVGILYQKLPYE